MVCQLKAARKKLLLAELDHRRRREVLLLLLELNKEVASPVHFYRLWVRFNE
jgi:ABC-type molybdate transport system ATPase subunit